MIPPDEIGTPRLRLVEATPELLEAELGGAEAFARAIGFDVPEEWPPEPRDRAAVERDLAQLGRGPEPPGGGRRYVALRASEAGGRPLVIGAVGFDCPPEPPGAVTLGGAILAEFRGCGFATEAVLALARHALALPGVRVVWAEALASQPAWIRVLSKAGFTLRGADAGRGSPGDADPPGALWFVLRPPFP